MALSHTVNANCLHISIFDRVFTIWKKFKSGGYIDVPKTGQNKNEEKDNLKVYGLMAKKYGGKYALITPDNTAGVKNPDAVNLKNYVYYDAKTQKGYSIKNAVQNGIHEASVQKAGEVIIRLNREATYKEVKSGLKAALQKGRAKTLKQVVILDVNGNLKQYDADKLRELFK